MNRCVILIDVDVAHIEAFVAVVDRGGFTRAAEALHVSQPALSRRIALLEHELRHPVFERDRKGARLTNAGRAFLPHAQSALACLRDGAAAVRALEGGDAGELTLAIVGTLASTDLTARLGAFRDAHPRVRLRLRTGTSSEVSSLVRRGDAELGLRYGADPAPDLVSSHVRNEHLVVVAATTHPLARERRIPSARLRGQAWVAFPPRRGTSAEPLAQALGRRLAAAGHDGAEIVAIDSLTAQKRLVEAGFGLGLVPASAVREELATDTLCRLDVPAFGATVDVALIHRQAGFLGPAARRLVAVLSEVEGVRPGGTIGTGAARPSARSARGARRAQGSRGK